MTVVDCLDGTILSLCTGFLPERIISLDTMNVGLNAIVRASCAPLLRLRMFSGSRMR
jgi:hypothetical protein